MAGRRSSLYDSFGFEWTLLALGSETPDTTAFALGAAALGLDLKVVMLAPESFKALYEAPLALIRPDQGVAGRGSDANRALQVLAQANGQGAQHGHVLSN